MASPLSNVAGGGVSGLLKVVGSSKLAMVGLTAAVIYGAYKLYDYASGAKAAREALEGMTRPPRTGRTPLRTPSIPAAKGLTSSG